MDWRWQPIGLDTKRDTKIVLHPTAGIWDVRRGFDPGSDDSIDLSEFVRDANHTAFEANVTLVFNRELFGAYQPRPNQVLEVQLFQNDEWKSLWLGHIDAITSFTLQRGERSMQLIAKTREQQDIWKNTPRVSPLYPTMTNLTYIVQRIGRMAGLQADEIVLPVSAITTAHSNTQLIDMTAWDMVSSVFVALGWTPYIDSLGRLRAANRELQGRNADIMLKDERMVKVGGQRQRPPVNRVRVEWLDPQLKIWKQQRRVVGNISCTVGWWQAWHNEEVKFSEDETLRVLETKLVKKQSLNNWVQFCTEEWTQMTPSKGKFHVDSLKNMLAVTAAIIAWVATHKVPDIHMHTHLVLTGATGPPLPPTVQGTGRIPEGVAGGVLMGLMMNVGTGVYEVWGTPYDFVHAKNVSEAFDASVPTWVNNVMDIPCDFIGDEQHAKAVAIRELIYAAQAANKWTVTIVDDPRIEIGDLLQFPDGSQLYVEDYTRQLGRGSEATLDLKGFVTGRRVTGKGKPISVVGGLPGTGAGAPGGPGGGPGGGTLPPWDGVPGSDYQHPIIAMSSDPAQIAKDVRASMAFYGRTDDQTWIDYCSGPLGPGDNFSDGKYYLGWNRYWEDRARPDDDGTSHPEWGAEPALHRDPSSGGGGGATMPNYSDVANAVAARYNLTIPSAQTDQGKAQLCRAIAWEIYSTKNTDVGLFRPPGTNVNGLSTDLCVLYSNGSYSDCTTADDNKNGTVTIRQQWSNSPGDTNTTQKDRWVQPTQALADAPGPMTKK